MKIRPVGAVLFHADGRTDRCDKVNSRFSQLFQHTLKWKAQMKRVKKKQTA